MLSVKRFDASTSVGPLAGDYTKAQKTDARILIDASTFVDIRLNLEFKIEDLRFKFGASADAKSTDQSEMLTEIRNS